MSQKAFSVLGIMSSEEFDLPMYCLRKKQERADASVDGVTVYKCGLCGQSGHNARSCGTGLDAAAAQPHVREDHWKSIEQQYEGESGQDICKFYASESGALCSNWTMFCIEDICDRVRKQFAEKGRGDVERIVIFLDSPNAHRCHNVRNRCRMLPGNVVLVTLPPGCTSWLQ